LTDIEKQYKILGNNTIQHNSIKPNNKTQKSYNGSVTSYNTRSGNKIH